jgi:hypothetical protein
MAVLTALVLDTRFLFTVFLGTRFLFTVFLDTICCLFTVLPGNRLYVGTLRVKCTGMVNNALLFLFVVTLLLLF